jgi:hypothetical protein
VIEVLTLQQPLHRVDLKVREVREAGTDLYTTRGSDYATLCTDTPEEDGGGEKRFEEEEKKRRRGKSVAIGASNPVGSLGFAERERTQGDIGL